MRTRLLQVLIRAALFVALVASTALFVDYQDAAGGGFCGEVGAGCGEIKAWAFRHGGARFLPALGMGAFVGLSLLAAWARRPRHWRNLAFLCLAAGLAAIVLISIQVQVGAICRWCLAVDVSTIVAAVAALALVGEPPAVESSAARVVWSGATSVAVLTPLFWEPPPPPPVPVPDAVQALRVEGKVNVIMFTDFQCPFCRRLHPLVDELARSDDRIHLTRVMVPLRMHPGAEPAALAYLCAPEARREALADALYGASPEALEPAAVVQLGASLGLDPQKLAACMTSEPIVAKLAADKALFSKADLQGLPSTFVGDELVVGADGAKLLAAVDRSLRGAKPAGGASLIWMFGFLGVVVAAAGGVSLASRNATDGDEPEPRDDPEPEVGAEPESDVDRAP